MDAASVPTVRVARRFETYARVFVTVVVEMMSNDDPDERRMRLKYMFV